MDALCTCAPRPRLWWVTDASRLRKKDEKKADEDGPTSSEDGEAQDEGQRKPDDALTSDSDPDSPRSDRVRHSRSRLWSCLCAMTHALLAIQVSSGQKHMSSPFLPFVIAYSLCITATICYPARARLIFIHATPFCLRALCLWCGAICSSSTTEASPLS